MSGHGAIARKLQGPAATPPAEFAAACMMTEASFMDLEGEAWAALVILANALVGENRENKDEDFEGPV